MNDLQKYSEINAISGYETTLKNELLNDLYYDEIINDYLGGFFVKINGSNPQAKPLVLMAHLDEVGLILSDVLDNGMLKFKTVGGISLEALINQRVLINGYPGIILGTSAHLQNDKKITLDDLVIDCGFLSKKQALQVVKIGMMIAFLEPTIQLGEKEILGKALDNRVGVAILVALNHYYYNNKIDADLYFGFTTQEEVGLRGAKTLTSCLKQSIDQIIVIDVSPVDDYYNQEPLNKLGCGFLLRIKDPYMLFDYELITKARNLCIKHHIAYQDFFSQGGMDSHNVSLTKNGKKVLALCVPGRNLHSANSIVNLDDINSLISFLKIYIKEHDEG